MRALILAALLVTGLAGVAKAEGLKPFQPFVDAAQAGDEIRPPPGTYAGPVAVNKALTINGQGHVTIDGGGKGTVVTLAANGATLMGLKIVNSGDSSNDVDAAVHVRGQGNIVRDNVIENVLFGIDLEQADGNVIRRNKISSKPVTLGLKGDAIRLWYSNGNRIEDNTVFNSRDLVVWYSNNNTILRNQSHSNRYGLHLMFANANLIEDNRFYNNSVGVSLMYSDDVKLFGNDIMSSPGPSGTCLSVKESSVVMAKKNNIVYCAIGINIDVSPYQPDTLNIFEGNRIAYNDTAIMFLSDWKDNEFLGNIILGNITQVTVNGGGSANRNRWEGNFWDDYEGFDRDKDGTGDKPYRLNNYAGRVWIDKPWARLFKGTPLLEVLDFLDRLAPFSEPVLLVQDERPQLDRNKMSLPALPRGGAVAEKPPGLEDQDRIDPFGLKKK
jgi:nitrous oxidase accessory protein